MLDFNRPAKDNFNERFSAAINAAMEAQNQAQARREYLGASRLGEECARKLQYEYTGAPKSRQFPGEVLRIFDRGHAGEAAMSKRLRLAGFEIVTETQRGGQLAVGNGPRGFRQHFHATGRAAQFVQLRDVVLELALGRQELVEHFRGHWEGHHGRRRE